MHRSKLVAILALAALTLMTVGTFAVLSTQKIVGGMGYIKYLGVSVYWDQQCTNATNSLDFGELEPGSSKNFTLYLRNDGSTPMTISMTSDNWNPANATDYMDLAWNCEGTLVNPDDVLEFAITLSVFNNVTGIDSFSLDIIITGTE